MNVRPLGVCPYCGSSRLVPLILIGGPLAAVDNKNDQCKCLECGRLGIPIEFDAVHDVDPFFAAQDALESPDFIAIPMLPLQMEGAKQEPLVRALTWDKEGPWCVGPGTPIRDYLKGRGIANDAEMLLVDIDGFRSGKQETDALKVLLRRRPSAWLSMGMTSEQDLYDGFAMGAGIVLADTFSAPSPGLFKELYALSDRCHPMVIYDGHVVWYREGEKDLDKVLDMLSQIGFMEIVVFDIRASEGEKDVELLAKLAARGDIIIAGGIKQADLAALEKMGMRGAILDPDFTEGSDVVG